MKPEQSPTDRDSPGSAAATGPTRDRESMSVGTPAAVITTTLASSTLLERAADMEHPGTNAAWQEIDARYRPLIMAYAQGKGLARASAETVAQDTMVAFADAVRNGKLDSHRSSRGYLFGIARHKLIDYIKRGGTIGVPPGQRPPDERDLPTAPESDPHWESSITKAIEKHIQDELRSHFKTRDVEIWKGRAIEGRPSKEVAEQHGVTVATVNMAIHRVRAFLREIEPVIRTRF